MPCMCRSNLSVLLKAGACVKMSGFILRKCVSFETALFVCEPQSKCDVHLMFDMASYIALNPA